MQGPFYTLKWEVRRRCLDRWGLAPGYAQQYEKVVIPSEGSGTRRGAKVTNTVTTVIRFDPGLVVSEDAYKLMAFYILS